jgi:hypothetical protein
VLAEGVMRVLNRRAMEAIHYVTVREPGLYAAHTARDISRAVVLADKAFQGILEDSEH